MVGKRIAGDNLTYIERGNYNNKTNGRKLQKIKTRSQAVAGIADHTSENCRGHVT